MAKIKKYSEEELKEKIANVLEKIDTIKVSRGRKSESADFLFSIKEVLIKALNKEMPFTQISKLIKDEFSIEISANVLKSFAKRELNYEPKKRNNINKIKEKPVTMQEMKETIKNKPQDEDSL